MDTTHFAFLPGTISNLPAKLGLCLAGELDGYVFGVGVHFNLFLSLVILFLNPWIRIVLTALSNLS